MAERGRIKPPSVIGKKKKKKKKKEVMVKREDRRGDQANAGRCNRLLCNLTPVGHCRLF